MDLQSKEIDYKEIQKLFAISEEYVSGVLILLRDFFPPEDITNAHVVAFLLAKYGPIRDKVFQLLFSNKTYNFLVRHGIKTFKQLCETDLEELWLMKGVGKVMRDEITDVLGRERWRVSEGGEQ